MSVIWHEEVKSRNFRSFNDADAKGADDWGTFFVSVDLVSMTMENDKKIARPVEEVMEESAVRMGAKRHSDGRLWLTDEKFQEPGYQFDEHINWSVAMNYKIWRRFDLLDTGFQITTFSLAIELGLSQRPEMKALAEKMQDAVYAAEILPGNLL